MAVLATRPSHTVLSCNVPTFGEESANATESVPMTKSLLAPSATAGVSPAISRRPGQDYALK